MKYDFSLTIGQKNDSLNQIINLIEPNSNILEIGCANGRLTKYLNEIMNCSVTIVEIDEEAGQEASVYAKDHLIGPIDGDIENDVWINKLSGQKFDYIIFADVIEHLRNPEEVLIKSKSFLTDEGTIVASLPNIANNAIILSLLNGEFDYRKLGLLDDTHIRFYTRNSFIKLINKIGLNLHYIGATYADVGHNEIDVTKLKYDANIIKVLKTNKDGNIYQNIFKFGLKEKPLIISDFKENSSELESSLFYKTKKHKDFNNTYIIKKEYEEGNRITIELHEEDNINALRFDPMEFAGLIKINKFEINKKSWNQYKFSTNALVSHNDVFWFINNDPMFIIEDLDLEKIVIEIEYEIIDVNYIKSDAFDMYALMYSNALEANLNYLKQNNELLEQIKLLEETEEKFKIRIDSIKHRSLFWKRLDRFNPFQYDSSIDYHIDWCKIRFNKLIISGWAKQADSKPIEIETNNIFVNVKQYIRVDVNEREELPKKYLSGFIIEISPLFVTPKIKFKANGGYNEYTVNGIKLVIKCLLKNILDVKAYLRVYGINKTIKYVVKNLLFPEKNMVSNYQKWLEEHRVNNKELKIQTNHRFEYEPLIDVLAIGNHNKSHLEELIKSISNQSYKNWRLHIIFDDISTKPADFNDERIEVIHSDTFKEVIISNNISNFKGDYITIIEADSVLEADAFFEVVSLLNKDKGIDVVYTDEDQINEDGITFENPLFKPDFAIDTLRSYNYISNLMIFKNELLRQVDIKGINNRYDLTLNIVDVASKISHISKMLYHSRNFFEDSFNFADSQIALEKHFERNKIAATITRGVDNELCKTNYKIEDEPLVSIVICTKDHINDLDLCLKSIINKTTYSNFEIVIVENNSVEQETFDYYQQIKDDRIKVIYWEHEFNYSAINNFGVNHAQGEYIVLLNNDIEVITPTWIEEMLMYAVRSDVGAVGAKLLYPDNTVQHAGVIIGLGGVAGHPLSMLGDNSKGYMNRLIISQNLSAVTAACLMIKKSIFEEVEGLSEKYKVAFNDVDFCLKVIKAGYLNVFTPYAKLYHYESKSRGYEDTIEKKERFINEEQLFKKDWATILDNGDPYYNINLSLKYGDFRTK